MPIVKNEVEVESVAETTSKPAALEDAQHEPLDATD